MIHYLSYGVRLGFNDEIREALVADILDILDKEKDEVGIYRYVFPCNPKPYSISGLQHFFGTAFIAARLAEFSGTDECEQAVAFLAGLLHDYEKMGLDLSTLKSGLNDVLGSDTKLYEALDEHTCGRYGDAVEVASKLESGGLPRKLQVVAKFVGLGDYITGGEDSWNVAYVMDLVKETLDEVGVKHYLVPVVIGKQRPVVAITAEKLEEELRSLGAIPLVSTPTGLLALSREPVDGNTVNGLYDSLTQYIASTSSFSTETMSGGSKRGLKINLDMVKNIIESSKTLMQARDDIERKSVRSRLSNQLGRVSTLHKLSTGDLIDAKMAAQTPEDRRRLAIYLVISLARTLHGVASDRTLRAILDEVGVGVSGGSVEETLIKLYDELGKSAEQLDKLLELLLDRAKKHLREMASGKEVEESISKVLKRTISVGFASSPPDVEGEETCSRCRERIKGEVARTLYEQLQVEQRATKVAYADVFHPDKQGKPESVSSMDGSAKKLSVCPVCFFESKVFTEVTGFVDGMWASNIVYFPAISADLLHLVKDIASNYVVVGLKRKEKKDEERKPLVIPDYVSSRIIVKTSDERGRLRKHNLLTALDLWYYIGGNLVLTTSALSAPPPWSGLPIEMETSDVIIEESIAKFVEELKVAKERNEWTRARVLRKTLYEQLKTYVQSLEEAEIQLGRSRFLKGGLAVSSAPSLDVYSFALRKQM